MGSLKPAIMTDEEVIRRYEAGESRGMIGLRAKKPDYWVVDVLIRNGIPLRAPSDWIALSIKTRAENKAIRERKIVEYARGTTGRRRA